MLEGGRGNDTLIGGTGADPHRRPDERQRPGLRFRSHRPGAAFDHVAFRDIDADDLNVRDTRSGALISWDLNDDGRSEGSILLKNLDVADLRPSDFMFVSEPQFVPGISDFGSHYIFS